MTEILFCLWWKIILLLTLYYLHCSDITQTVVTTHLCVNYTDNFRMNCNTVGNHLLQTSVCKQYTLNEVTVFIDFGSLKCLLFGSKFALLFTRSVGSPGRTVEYVKGLF